jgi:hypothetical protein
MRLKFYLCSVGAALLVCVCAQKNLADDARVFELRSKYDALIRESVKGSEQSVRPAAPASGSVLFVAADQYTPAVAAVKVADSAAAEHADALYELAKQAAEAGQSSLAFQWTTEVLRENPDHADARRVLGYVERDGKWLTAYGAKMLDAGKIWDATRGWVSGKGEKPASGGGAADVARHAEIKNGWQVRTDHFLVTTNHSQAAGAELATRLERLYQVWRQLFAGFYYSDKEMRGLFAGERIARVPSRQFRVFYHRDHDDYVKNLVRRQSMVGDTLGIYFDNIGESHFFAPDDAAKGAKNATASALTPVATLYHEAVHQLFQESKPTSHRFGEVRNFWVIEGVATYFETLSEHPDARAGLYYTIGESSAGRLPAARERLGDNYYVPLAELAKLGKSEMQRRPDVAKVYSESCGLAAFLIDGEHGRYREPLVRYLQAVYAGHDNDGTLADVTGRSYEELDAEYRRFMESLP